MEPTNRNPQSLIRRHLAALDLGPMTELIHERRLELRDRQGRTYGQVLVYAEQQPAGTWAAWVEFVSESGEVVVRTDPETTQSTLKGVTCWATGLQRTYFEGALDRAAGGTGPGARPPPSGGGMVSFRIRSADPHMTSRVMAAPTVILPGHRRPVLEEGTDEGDIIYVRTVEPALAEMPRIYEFLAHFASSSAASALAERLEADLRGTEATLEIRRVDVPIESAAILTALVSAVADSGPEVTANLLLRWRS